MLKHFSHVNIKAGNECLPPLQTGINHIVMICFLVCRAVKINTHSLCLTSACLSPHLPKYEPGAQQATATDFGTWDKCKAPEKGSYRQTS